MTPPPSPPRPEVVTRGAPRRARAWIERATSADHKTVGLLYIGTALVFLVLAAVEFALMRAAADRAGEHDDQAGDLQPPALDRGVTFVVLFAIPLALG